MAVTRIMLKENFNIDFLACFWSLSILKNLKPKETPSQVNNWIFIRFLNFILLLSIAIHQKSIVGRHLFTFFFFKFHQLSNIILHITPTLWKSIIRKPRIRGEQFLASDFQLATSNRKLKLHSKKEQVCESWMFLGGPLLKWKTIWNLFCLFKMSSIK